VTDGFVQQHSGPSGTEDDFHLACRSFAGIELQNRLPRCFAGEVFWRRNGSEKNSMATRPPPPELPRAELVSVLAMQPTLNRARGWESSANVPSEATIKIRRSSSP